MDCSPVPEEFTDAQWQKMKWFWQRAKPKGWRYAKEAVRYSDGTLKLTFTLGPHKHWILFSPDGDCVPAPTTMACRGDIENG